jgi:3-dehydroquinate dehydratase/shikimate dehydrogenase
VLAARFQSAWTYAGDAVAPGQVSGERLIDEFSFRRLGTGSALYGVVGRPVMHSLSPAMHNAAFRNAGLDAVYLPLAAADYEDFTQFAEAFDLVGASVTAPFKLAAFQRAATADSVSRRIEAANTLRRANGQWDARNTDVAGFLAPLRSSGVALDAIRATILGAGGAARAAADALCSAGTKVSIASRRRERAEDTAHVMRCDVADWPPAAGSWDLLVNATPVGTCPADDDTPLPNGPFTGQLVYDLVYNPPETRLLRDAAAAGCRTIGGLDMLAAQAVLQFEWWTGITPSLHTMRDAALSALRARTIAGTLA